MKAADVSSSTSPLMSRNIAVSFRRIGQSPNAMLMARGRNDLGGSKELGAERQPGRLRGFEIDAEADLALVEDESNDAAGPGEVIAVAHGENRTVLERGDDLVQPIGLGPTDEEDMTVLDLFQSPVAAYLEGSTPHRLS